MEVGLLSAVSLSGQRYSTVLPLLSICGQWMPAGKNILCVSVFACDLCGLICCIRSIIYEFMYWTESVLNVCSCRADAWCLERETGVVPAKVTFANITPWLIGSSLSDRYDDDGDSQTRPLPFEAVFHFPCFSCRGCSFKGYSRQKKLTSFADTQHCTSSTKNGGMLCNKRVNAVLQQPCRRKRHNAYDN